MTILLIALLAAPDALNVPSLDLSGITDSAISYVSPANSITFFDTNALVFHSSGDIFVRPRAG